MHDPSIRPAPRQLTMLNPLGLYDPSANGYSHVAMIPPGAGLVCVAGQGGERADGSLPDGFEAQVRQALDNLRVALAAAGSQLQQVARLTVLVVDHDAARLAVLSGELRRAWGDAPAPACTLIPVPRLALDGMLFEIDALAVAHAPRAA